MKSRSISIPLFQSGSLVSGKTPIIYPYGDSSVYVTSSSETNGIYTFEIDVQSQPDMIAQEYTISESSAVVTGYERMYFGPWVWKIREVSPASFPYQVGFSSLTDEDGDALPERINKAYAQVNAREERGIFCYVSDEDLDGVYDTLNVDTVTGAGSGDTDIDIIIFGG